MTDISHIEHRALNSQANDTGAHQPIAIDPDTGIEVIGRIHLISPKLIRASASPNRDGMSNGSSDFGLLKELIETAGGNEVPIAVRRRPEKHSDGTEFELIYGHRRHQACLALNLPVRAIIQECDDYRAYVQRLRENSGRVELTPLEIGRQIVDGLERGHLHSIRHAATLIGRDQSDLAKATKLAALDERVIAAFECPSELQYRHAKPLFDACKANMDAVIEEAKRIATMEERPGTNEVVDLLATAASGGVGQSHTLPLERRLEAAGRHVGRMKCNRNNQVSIQIEVPLLDKDRESLARQLEKFLGQRLASSSLLAATRPSPGQGPAVAPA